MSKKRKAGEDAGGKVKISRSSEYLKFYSKVRRSLELWNLDSVVGRQGKEGKPLSNFHQGTITVNERTYASGEAAFHGEKFFLSASDSSLSAEDRGALLAHAEQFLSCSDPMKAKRMGGKGKDGHRLKLSQLAMWDGGGADEIQLLICQAKLDTDPSVAQALDGSGSRPLLHQDNRAKPDTPWGGRIDKDTGGCIGLNKLGQIWMRLRESRAEARA